MAGRGSSQGLRRLRVASLFAPGPSADPSGAARWVSALERMLDAAGSHAGSLASLALASPPALARREGAGLMDSQLRGMVSGSPLLRPGSALRQLELSGAHCGPAALAGLFESLAARGAGTLDSLVIVDHMAPLANEEACLESLASLVSAMPGLRRLALATHPTAARLVLRTRAARALAEALEGHAGLRDFCLRDAPVVKTGGPTLLSREENKAIGQFAEALRRNRGLERF